MATSFPAGSVGVLSGAEQAAQGNAPAASPDGSAPAHVRFVDTGTRSTVVAAVPAAAVTGATASARADPILQLVSGGGEI